MSVKMISHIMKPEFHTSNKLPRTVSIVSMANVIQRLRFQHSWTRLHNSLCVIVGRVSQTKLRNEVHTTLLSPQDHLNLSVLCSSVCIPAVSYATESCNSPCVIWERFPKNQIAGQDTGVPADMRSHELNECSVVITITSAIYHHKITQCSVLSIVSWLYTHVWFNMEQEQLVKSPPPQSHSVLVTHNRSLNTSSFCFKWLGISLVMLCKLLNSAIDLRGRLMAD